NLDERTTTEHEVTAPVMSRGGGAKPASDEILLELRERGGLRRHLAGMPSPGLASNHSRTSLRANDLAQECCQELVWTLCFPRASHFRVQPIEQARAARAVAYLIVLEHQSRILQHCKVLAHGVVVETEQIGEFCDTDGPIGISDKPEDPMTGAVA